MGICFVRLTNAGGYRRQTRAISTLVSASSKESCFQHVQCCDLPTLTAIGALAVWVMLTTKLTANWTFACVRMHATNSSAGWACTVGFVPSCSAAGRASALVRVPSTRLECHQDHLPYDRQLHTANGLFASGGAKIKLFQTFRRLIRSAISRTNAAIMKRAQQNIHVVVNTARKLVQS